MRQIQHDNDRVWPFVLLLGIESPFDKTSDAYNLQFINQFDCAW